MSFRPTGRARVNPRWPQAWAVCDRCGFVYNHVDLYWQFDWEGPRLQNLRKLVCQTCTDQPFEHHRTIIIPPDPIPIANPRPEFYNADDNPDSIPAPNWDPLALMAYASTGITKSGNIGNLTMGGGVDGAFRDVTSSWAMLPSSVAGAPVFKAVKTSAFSALKVPSLNGLLNYVGQNWSAQPGTPPPPFQTQTPSNNLSSNSNGVVLPLQSFFLQAPSDQAFLAGSSSITIELDGWTGTAWTPLWSGATVGSVGESFSVALSASAQGSYYGHRVLLTGDGTHAIAVAECGFVGLAEMQSSFAPSVQPS